MISPELVVAFLVGTGVAAYPLRWLINKFSRELEHRHRVIEEHTKKLHENIERYYFPYIIRARGLADRLSETPVQKELCFFALARYLSIGKEWIEEIGGLLLLRDLTAERLILSIDLEVLNRIRQHFGSGDVAEIVKHTQVDEDLSDFRNKVQTVPSLGAIFSGKFQTWLQQKSELAKWLRSLVRLFLFEINNCYKEWYGKPPIKPIFGSKRIDQNLVKELLNKLKEEGEISAKDKKKYLKRLGLGLDPPRTP